MAQREREVMQILCTDVYQTQLHAILDEFAQEDLAATKSFKLYLDTIIVNIPTKVGKYKKSVLFDDENIKDVEHKGFRIPFYIEEKTETYLLLGMVKI